MISPTRATTSSPLPSPSTNNNERCTSHITLDLSQRCTAKAVQSLSGMPKRMNKIKTAHVYLSRPSSGIHRKTTLQDIVEMFVVLGRMPYLTSVEIDLNHLPYHHHQYSGSTTNASNDGGRLPLTALIRLLQSSKRLKSLRLSRLDIMIPTTNAQTAASASVTTTSNDDIWKELKRTLVKNTKQLQEISVVHCMGSKGVASLVGLMAKYSRSLRRVRFKGTSISSYILSRLTNQKYQPQLRILHLEDLPDITDDHIFRLCDDLERAKTIQSGSNDSGADDSASCCPPIQELHISSNILTEAAGDRLARMLCTNTTLETVTLHMDCERLASGMVRCFKVNETLRNVDIRCYGDDDDVCETVIEMATALQQNPSLQRLRLCLEIEPLESQKEEIVAAFATMMLSETNNTNTSLQELVLDDGVRIYGLGDDLQLQLELNRCGYSRLIRGETTRPTGRHPDDGAVAVTTRDWMEALGDASDNISSIYTILSNCPWLICRASARVAGTGTPTSGSKAESGTLFQEEEEEEALPPAMKLMDNSSNKNANHQSSSLDHGSSKRHRLYHYGLGGGGGGARKALPTRTSSGKTLKRMVKAILAPSA